MPKRTHKTQIFLIEAKVPRGADFNEVRDYIIDSLEAHGRGLHPSHTMFPSMTEIKVSKPIIVWRPPKSKPL